MTSPRTPRQILGWTVPDHIESGTIGRWVNVTCRHGACHGTPESSRTYYVPAMSVAAAPAPFATFLRNHAHGGEVTDTLAPLSEVLPETPEPPREDEEHDDLADVPLEDHGTWTKRQAVTRRDEAERGAERCYFEGCPEWITGSSDYCPTHDKLYAPVPASQSVPAVPVSSTGGKETGTAAENATEALNVRWYPVVDDTIGGWAISNVDLPVSELDTRDGKHFTVGDFLSEEIARHLCELHNAALSLPDSETVITGKGGSPFRVPDTYATDGLAAVGVPFVEVFVPSPDEWQALVDRATSERAIPEPTEGQNP